MSTNKYIERAGNFVCIVENPGETGWFGEANNDKKTPYIRIPLRVLDGDQKDKITVWQGWLSDGAFDNTIKALAKAFPEWDGDLAQLAPDGNFSFQGLQCEIVTEIEQYTNTTTGISEDRVRAKWLNPVGGGGGGKPLAADTVKGIIAKFGRKSLAIAKSTRAEAGMQPKSSVSAPAGTSAGSSAPEDQLPM